MTTYNFLKFETENQIGILTINREDKLNALNIELLEELKTFLLSLHKESAIKSLIVTGAGEKAFIAGADIAAMSGMGPAEGENFARLGQEVTLLFEELPFPVIAAVNGFALGGGCEMALACDFILCTQNAVFGLPEVKLGLIPGFGGTQRLAKIVGRNFAKEMIYTGKNIKADEAQKLGLTLEVFVTKAELMNGCMKKIEMILGNSPYAIGVAKRVINLGADISVSDGLKIEKEQFGAIFSSHDMREGCTAFVEKRKPQFKGN
jgi:enoyl-CoA hydratase